MKSNKNIVLTREYAYTQNYRELHE